MSRVITLLFLLALLLAGCNSRRGPKQTLVFKATPLPGVAASDVERSQDVVASRLHNAELSRGCRFQVELPEPLRLEVTTYGATEEDIAKIKEFVRASATLEFAPIASPRPDEELLAAAKDVVGEVKIDDVVRGAWLPGANPDSNDLDYLEASVAEGLVRRREVDGKSRREWLVAYDPECRVTGDHLKSVHATLYATGAPALALTMRTEEVWRMSNLTGQLTPSRNLNRNLAIIWNGGILSAPRVQSQINAQGQITGNFTPAEAKQMAALLRSGQLPCVFEFEKAISSADGR